MLEQHWWELREGKLGKGRLQCQQQSGREDPSASADPTVTSATGEADGMLFLSSTFNNFTGFVSTLFLWLSWD